MIFLKALITGASGFVGRVLSQSLLNRNIEVLGISRSISFIDGVESSEYRCDVLEKAKLKNIVQSYRPDYVVHLAAPAYIPASLYKPEMTYEVIFNGTMNVLESVKEMKSAAKVLYISSADIYGRGGNKILSESDAFDPINPYSSAKACAELLCKQFHNTYALDVTIARPFNHTGPGQSVDFVCSSFAYQVAAMLNQQIRSLYVGNIDVQRDFLDVRDVVNAYIELLTVDGSGEVYNVCSGTSVPIRRIIEILFKKAQIDDYEIVMDPEKTRNNDMSIRVGNNQRIKSATNWEPQYKLEDTINDLFQYWKENMSVIK